MAYNLIPVWSFFLGTIYLLTQSVIQTTAGRKNLGNTHFMFPRSFASLWMTLQWVSTSILFPSFYALTNTLYLLHLFLNHHRELTKPWWWLAKHQRWIAKQRWWLRNNKDSLDVWMGCFFISLYSYIPFSSRNWSRHRYGGCRRNW